MHPFPVLLRSVLVSFALTVLLPSLAYCGELKTTIVSVAQTCVGQELTLVAKIENINASFSVHNVVATTTVKQGSTVLATKTSSQFDLATSTANNLTIATGWTAQVTGAYTVEVSADGSDDINGPQIATAPFTVCPAAPCPERPTASGNVIYLGSGSTGSITYSAQPLPCCYEIKVTVVTGHDAVTSKSPESWTQVGTSTAVSATVDRSKWNGSYVTLRVDWRKCDRTASGSDYVLVRDGSQQTASGTTTQPVGTTAGNTPQAGIVGDPVVTATREFVMPVAKLDAEVLSRVDVGMGRSYQSLLETVVHKDADFGPGWTHSYDWNAVVGDGEAYVNGPGGFTARFRGVGNTWTLDWPKNGPYSFSAPDASSYLFGDGGSNLVVGFDANGRLSKVGNSFGYFNTVNWTGRWISSIKTPSGNGITLTRDTNGFITSLTNGVKAVSYGYTAGNLSYFQDGMANRTVYNYTPGTSFLTHWVTPEGRTPLTNTYDAQGHVTKQDQGDGFVIDLSFLNNKTTITYPGGIASSQTHDAKNQLIEVKNQLGSTATFGYDANGNRTSVTDMMGGTISRTFTNGLMSRTTLADGSNWFFDRGTRTYQGLTMQDVEQIGITGKASTTITRNADGTPKDITAPSGYQTKFEYTNGLPTHIFGYTSDNRYTYNTDGLVASRITKDGKTYTFQRNASGHIISVTSDASTMEYRYNANQDLTAILNGSSQRQWGYDKDRELTSYTDQDNHVWSRLLDTRGRVSELRNPLGLGAKYSWTGPIMTGIELGNGAKYTFVPSLSGLPGTITNAAGNAWNVNYNAEGRPTKLTYPDGTSNTYGFDAAGRTTDVTSPTGLKYEFKYDPWGVMNNYTSPGVAGTEVTRNDKYTTGSTKVGGITLGYESGFTNDDFRSKIIDGNGYSWTTDIDGVTGDATYTSPSGRKTKIDWAGMNRIGSVEWGPTAKATYTYSGNQSTGIQVGSESINWDFTDAGQLTTFNGDAITRDAAGRVTKQNGVEANRTPNGVISDYSFEGFKISKYQYDVRGFVSSVEDSKGGKTNVTIDARGRLSDLEFPGGYKISYEWNADDKIDKVSASDGWSMTYERDQQGRVTSRTRTDNVPFINLQMPVERPITYDNDNRVSGATYDGYGNYEKSPKIGSEYSFGPFGLHNIKYGTGELALTNDAYGYPKSATDKHGAIQFHYNVIAPNATPIKLTMPNGETTIVQLPNGRPLYGLDAAGNRTFFIDDGMGSVIAQRNGAGEYNWQRTYTPFGATIGSSGTPSPLGYKGLEGAVTLLDGTVLHLHNVYNPDYGQVLNRVGIVQGYPFNTDPRQENLQGYSPREYLDGPTNSFFGKGGLYSADCNLDGGSVTPQKSGSAVEYVRVESIYGSGYFYVPGTETAIRIGGYLRYNYDDNSSADLLKLGYGKIGGFYPMGDRNLRIDESVREKLEADWGISRFKYNWGPKLDYGYCDDPDYDDDETDDPRDWLDVLVDDMIIDLYIDELFGELFPSTGQLVSPTPTPTPQPHNDTQKKK